MKSFFIACIAMICSIPLCAQESMFSVSGILLDKATNEPLPFATVNIIGTEAAVVTDIEGRFKIQNVQRGTLKILISYVGYQNINMEWNVQSDIENVVLYMDPPGDPGPVITVREVTIEGTRANEKTPMAYTELTTKDIAPLNNGQDMPYILKLTPSLVATSDAGNGIGYTGLWIRGSDPSRINVTINGIPLNDPESQQVFWVNTPDFGSSVNNIQIQRGIGTSANGAASFGGSIKLETRGVRRERYAEVNNTYGSFNTWRQNVQVGTGLIKNRFIFEGRLSRITSEGYIDRASSDLQSFFAEANYLGSKTIIKLTAFGGRERTYQSWYGTPAEVLGGNMDSLLAFAGRNGFNESQTQNLLTAGRTYNFYDYKNQVDNYTQDHYQLHISRQISPALRVNASGHYTHGKGFFEEYKNDQYLSDYGLVPEFTDSFYTDINTDLVRRRWLKNDFYGTVVSVVYQGNRLESILGGAWNDYRGTHFGEFTWMQETENFNGQHYYDGKSDKRDANVYWKNSYNIFRNLDIYADLQLRSVRYGTAGISNDLLAYDIHDDLLFLNPKFGLNAKFNNALRAYASIAMAGKEPNRNDYLDATDFHTVKPEHMVDVEAGIKQNRRKMTYGINGYYMQYKDQLVLTGELNDVGAPLRINVPNSYRRGVEAELSVSPNENLKLAGNVTLSQNKILQFDEVLYNYTDGFDVEKVPHRNTDISFSPSVINAAQIGYTFHNREKTNSLEITIIEKFVGKQYMDNTQDDRTSIDPYLVNDLRFMFNLGSPRHLDLAVNFTINNVLNAQYVSNGYTYSYIYETRITERFYYPQAGRNFLLGLGLKF